MPVEYRYNAQERIVEIRCFGTLVIHEIERYFADLAEDESVALGAVELVDLSDVALFDVDFNEAAAMPEEYALAWGRKRILGTLLFGTNDLNEGLAHLIKAHFNRTLPSHFFAVVASREAARDEARRLLEKAG
jgi:hypothetical protein